MSQIVKIRHRQVICRKPQYGRYDEFQVVQGRKVLSRHDLQSQAEKWCRDRGLSYDPATVTTANNSPPVFLTPHNSGERLPSSDAAGAGGETLTSTDGVGEK